MDAKSTTAKDKTHFMLHLYCWLGAAFPYGLFGYWGFQAAVEHPERGIMQWVNAIGGALFLAAVAYVWMIAAQLAWTLGDAIRLKMHPGTVYVHGDIGDIARVRLFWAIGPQSFAVFFAWLVTFVLFGALATAIHGLFPAARPVPTAVWAAPPQTVPMTAPPHTAPQSTASEAAQPVNPASSASLARPIQADAGIVAMVGD